MSDPENNGPEYGWFANRSGTDSREAPQGIEAFFVLNDGAGNRIALRTDNVRLVRLDGEGAPEVIEPLEGGLYPPESFDPSSGAIARGYGLQINPENPPQQEFPEGSFDEDGFVNTSMWGPFVAWMRPDPNDPSQNIRFNPVEEGFQIRRYEEHPYSPAADAGASFAAVAAVEPAADQTPEVTGALAYAASIYEREGDAEYAGNVTAQILSDYEYNSAGENFDHIPQLDENGMIATIRTEEGISSVWHDEQGREMLLNAEEIEGILAASDLNESTLNVLALAIYAVHQVINGAMEPTQDRTAAMRWYPFVTFSQVGADMLNAADMPAGHGHNYDNVILDGWVAVAPPPQWTPADTERIRAALDETVGPEGSKYSWSG